jgi:hypothetical protein
VNKELLQSIRENFPSSTPDEWPGIAANVDRWIEIYTRARIDIDLVSGFDRARLIAESYQFKPKHPDETYGNEV